MLKIYAFLCKFYIHFLKASNQNSLAGPATVNFDQQRALRAHQTRFRDSATWECKSDKLWASVSKVALPGHPIFPNPGSPCRLAIRCFSAHKQRVANGDAISRHISPECRCGWDLAWAAWRCTCPPPWTPRSLDVIAFKLEVGTQRKLPHCPRHLHFDLLSSLWWL